MYESHWHLQSRPFEPFTEEAFHFPAESHQGALLKLRYAVEQRREAAVLAGPPGCGKSHLVRVLMKQLGEEYQPSAHLVFPDFSSTELLAYTADAIAPAESNSSGRTAEASIQRIESFLAKNREEGRHALIVFDEAHRMAATQGLETIRLVLNLAQSGPPAMTVLLVGLPDVLRDVERVAGLESRLAVKTLLRPFDEAETAEYVQHRIQAAGGEHAIFDESALSELYARSGGIARAIDRLCDLALLVGFAEQQPHISAEQIGSLATELVDVAPE